MKRKEQNAKAKELRQKLFDCCEEFQSEIGDPCGVSIDLCCELSKVLLAITHTYLLSQGHQMRDIDRQSAFRFVAAVMDSIRSNLEIHEGPETCIANRD